MIRDFNVEWLRKRIYIPVQQFSGIGDAAVGAGYVQHTGLASFGSGTRQLLNINSLGIGGLTFTTAGDAVLHTLMVPYDLDITKQISFRLHWTSGTSAAAMQWSLVYGLQNASVGSENTTSLTSIGSATLGALTTPATALDTTIPSATGQSTGYSWEITDFGIINKNTLAKNAYGILLKVSCSGTIQANTFLLGLEMRYTTRKMVGPRRNIIGGRRLVDLFGVQWTQSHQEGL